MPSFLVDVNFTQSDKSLAPGHKMEMHYRGTGATEEEVKKEAVAYYQRDYFVQPGTLKVVKVTKVSNAFENGRARAEAELAQAKKKLEQYHAGNLKMSPAEAWDLVAQVEKLKKEVSSSPFQNGRARAEAELAPRLARFGNGPKYRVGQRVEVIGDKGWSEESRVVDFRDGKYVVEDSDGEKGLFTEDKIRPWR